VYICPAGERLIYRYTNEEEGLVLRRYRTTACLTCTRVSTEMALHVLAYNPTCVKIILGTGPLIAAIRA
jgi:hypothetical protein